MSKKQKQFEPRWREGHEEKHKDEGEMIVLILLHLAGFKIWSTVQLSSHI